jgi:hypothetical protein
MDKQLTQRRNFSADSKKGMTGFALKMIAVITMLVDHIGAAVIEPVYLNSAVFPFKSLFDSLFAGYPLEPVAALYIAMRFIGRLAFPIYCFLLTEGFAHTRSVRRYARNLFLFALISELPFNLAFFRQIWFPNHLNVFFTLLLGLIAMWGHAAFPRKPVLRWLIPVGCALVALSFRTDYGAFGVVLIFLLYILRERRRLRTAVGAIAVGWEVTAPLAFIPIHLYNGQRGGPGQSSLWGKYIFYLFYPAHLLILSGIRLFLLRG